MSQRTAVLLVMAYALVGGVLSAISTWADRIEALAEAEWAAQNMARLMEEHAIRTLDAARMVLDYIQIEVADDSLGQLAGREEWRSIRVMAEGLPQLHSVWVVDPAGRTVLATAPLPEPHPSAADHQWFRAHRRGALGPSVGERQEDPHGISFFTLSRRIEGRAGNFLGVAVATIDSAYFSRFYETLPLGRASAVALYTADGRLIAGQPPTETPGAPFPPEGLLAASPAGVFRPDVGVAADAVVAYRAIRPLGIVAVVALAPSDILAEWWQRLVRNAFFALLALAALAGFSVFAMRAIGREEAVRRQLETALNDKDMLLRELHHRVKNNLQVVASLLGMQAIRFEAPEMREALQHTLNRVQAMGLVHELLYRQERGERLDFLAYLRMLCGNLADSYGARQRGIEVTVGGDPVSLEINTAIPAGLIVNEVVTNSLKYAFPDGRTGHVRVTVTREDQLCRIFIDDDGIGLPQEVRAGRTSGMGMLLIRSLATQLGGSQSFEEGDGTHCRVSFPCA